MFDDSSPEDIEELRKNTASRIILELVVKAAKAKLSCLKFKRIDEKDFALVQESMRDAYFDAAQTVEFECWGSEDFSASYKRLIESVQDGKTIQETIATLEKWIVQAEGYGF